MKRHRGRGRDRDRYRDRERDRDRDSKVEVVVHDVFAKAVGHGAATYASLEVQRLQYAGLSIIQYHTACLRQCAESPQDAPRTSSAQRKSDHFPSLKSCRCIIIRRHGGAPEGM